MNLSLVIATRDRASQLEEALEFLIRLHCQQAWELVIVDNASSDATPQILADFGKRFPGDIRLLRYERPGLGELETSDGGRHGARSLSSRTTIAIPKQTI